MSLINERKIKCPKCNCESEMTIYESVNTVINPELKEKVLKGDAFIFECPKCKTKVPVDYKTLYHIMDKKIMITNVHNEDELKSSIEGFKRNSELCEEMDKNKSNDKDKGYYYRIVTNLNELREKAIIFDNDLDDRIIEIIKILFVQNLMKEKPNTEVAEALFYINENKEMVLDFLSRNDYITSGIIPKEMYDEFKDEFKGKLKDVHDDELFIDVKWAIDFLNEVGEKEG